MNGRQFAALVRSLPAEERDLPVATLVELYDRPTCSDCGRHHASVWAAMACEELVDARGRRNAARAFRRKSANRSTESGESPVEVLDPSVVPRETSS